MFTPIGRLLGWTWEEGVLHIGIRARLHFPWVKVAGHACMSVSYVSLTLALHVLVALHHVDHGCSKVVMRNLM